MRIRIAMGLALLMLAPSVVLGQQTAGVIAGQVRDTTGAVLPGVTVEVASPALIEKVRTVVTDDSGQYRVVELRPGEYTVTFTLAGFGKVVRENVQLTTGFTATVNADLQVGDIAETITVSGAAPVVDLQNTTQQAVLSRTVLDAIPTGRSYGAIGRLIPGMDNVGNAGGHDVGGTSGRDTNKLVTHGGATDDFKLQIDGFPQNTFTSGGGDNIGVPQPDSLAEEFNLQYSALPAEVETGGVMFNIVPKTGGNQFRGSFFGNFATSAMQFENVTPEYIAQGLEATAGAIDYVTDVNPSFGGPIQRDRVWFFVTYRDFRPYQYSIMHYDTDVTDWVYTRDTSRPLAYEAKPQKTIIGRLTWQVSPRNRITGAIEGAKITQPNFFVGGKGTTINAPEGSPLTTITHRPIVGGSWTAPLTNRLLIEAGAQNFRGRWNSVPQRDISIAPGAVETTTGIQFRSAIPVASTGYQDLPWRHQYFRGSVSYTTGTHAIKVGTTLWLGRQQWSSNISDYGPYTLRLLRGVPNAVVYRVHPLFYESDLFKTAVFAQDQWTVRRLTVNAGLRLDTINTWFPDQHEEPTAYFPARDFARGDVLNWKDLSPRLGVAYDLFGNGRTAIKGSASRYVQSETTRNTTPVNPAQASGATLTRTWVDRNGDYVPQGDPTDPLANGEIGPSPNAFWGQARFSTRHDPEWARGGWGVRPYNWELSAGIQQELRSNVSLTVNYVRRIQGNFITTDNVLQGPGDFDTFCIPVPVDSRLPGGGGGGQLCDLYDVKPGPAFGRQDNLVTRASNYGDVSEIYNGVDAGLNLRLPRALLQGGFSTGTQVYDYCDIVDELPELLIAGNVKRPRAHCHQEQPYLTQVKLLGSYELPWAFTFAATYMDSYNWGRPTPNFVQGQPRMGHEANYLATNAVIAPNLGRNLAAGANATATVNLVQPGTLFMDRLRQLDVRLGRTFRAGRTSIKAMIDLYNALNTNTITNYNTNYGITGATWNNPLAILPGRLLKLGMQLDF